LPANPQKLEGHGGFVRSVAFNADGSILASAGFDNQIILWNTQTGARIGPALTAHTKPVNAVVFGADETADILFSASSDHTVIRWDLSTRQPLSQPIKDVSPPQGIGITAKNGFLEASVVNVQQIQLSGWADLLTGHTGAVNSLSFSPEIDGKLLLASASDDQTVILWDASDVANADVFLKLESFDNPVSMAYFDRKQLVTIEKNGRSIRWTIAPSDWLPLVCGAVKRNLSNSEWQSYLPNQPQRKTCESNP
jgi:WD40 repeat protein